MQNQPNGDEFVFCDKLGYTDPILLVGIVPGLPHSECEAKTILAEMFVRGPVDAWRVLVVPQRH